jgi:hypothetical protein
MVRYLRITLFVFLMLSSFAFAKTDEAKLKSEFGDDLTKAPFFLRFSFQKEFNKDWNDTDYAERKAFLAGYDASVGTEQVKDIEDTKAAQRAEKARLRAKNDEARKERYRLKALAAAERAEKRAQEEREKAVNAADKAQQRELQDMLQQAASGH